MNAYAPQIVHVDVDTFFASVKQVLDSHLRGKPVLVGRGMVASASYEAKARGVKTAMTFRRALELCPNAIVVPLSTSDAHRTILVGLIYDSAH